MGRFYLFLGLIFAMGPLGAQGTLTLPDGRVIKKTEYLQWEANWYPLKAVTVYEKPSLEAPSKKIGDLQAAVFGPIIQSSWLYLVSKDLSLKGYIPLASITGDSFYGNKKDQESGNYYLSLLARERAFLATRPEIQRQGPLLTIKTGATPLVLLDSFSPRGSHYAILKDLGGDYLILEWFWEGSVYRFCDKATGALSPPFTGEPQVSPEGLRVLALGIRSGRDPLYLNIFQRTQPQDKFTWVSQIDLSSYYYKKDKNQDYQARWTSADALVVAFENGVQVEVKKTGEKWTAKEILKK